jgi:hypothetical protein
LERDSVGELARCDDKIGCSQSTAIQDAVVVVVDDEVDHADERIKWDLHDLEGDERAGEPVDPDPVVLMVGAN